MLLLNPRTATFGSTRFEDCLAISIDRSPAKQVEAFSDLGPYAVLADVPEQRVRIRIVQELNRDDVNAPIPGQQAQLSFYTSPNRSDAGRRKVAATAVVLQCEHEVALKKGAHRTIVFAAISSGSADPITMTDAPAGDVED